MTAIVFTSTEKNNLYTLINDCYNASSYESFDNFKTQEKRDIVVLPLNNNLFALSLTVLSDDIYKDLKDYILANMSGPLLIRDIEASEIPADGI